MKLHPLLGTPFTVTTTVPVAAAAGTVATICVAPQLVVAAAAPPKVTVLVPWLSPKLVPEMVTAVPTGPVFGDRPVMLGVGNTVKPAPLLAKPFTVTITFPVLAPAGTGTWMEVALQLLEADATPLNVTTLLP